MKIIITEESLKKIIKMQMLENVAAPTQDFDTSLSRLSNPNDIIRFQKFARNTLRTYNWKIDGLWGKRSQKAWNLYRENPSARPASFVNNKNEVYKFQTYAKKLGAYLGTPDGIWGPNSQRAWNQLKSQYKNGSQVDQGIGTPTNGRSGANISSENNKNGDWDVNKSVKWILSQPPAKGLCATYVLKAIAFGGGPVMYCSENGGDSWADCLHYNGILASHGFYLIASGRLPERGNYTGNLQPGDIMISDAHIRYKRPGKTDGKRVHAAMWCGNQWVSDFRQNNANVYGYPVDFWIYRYAGGTKNRKENNKNSTISVDGENGNVNTNVDTTSMDTTSGIGTSTQNNNGNDKVIEQKQAIAAQNAGLSVAMLNKIAFSEAGVNFGEQLPQKCINGIKDTSGLMAYGYGSSYDSNGRTPLENFNKKWTQEELEKVFVGTLKRITNRIKQWAVEHNITLNQNQIDAIACACYNFGLGFILSYDGKPRNLAALSNLIARDPNNRQIYDMWCNLSSGQVSRYAAENPGKSIEGLNNRRVMEANWYFGRTS